MLFEGENTKHDLRGLGRVTLTVSRATTVPGGNLIQKYRIACRTFKSLEKQFGYLLGCLASIRSTVGAGKKYISRV